METSGNQKRRERGWFLNSQNFSAWSQEKKKMWLFFISSLFLSSSPFIFYSVSTNSFVIKTFYHIIYLFCVCVCMVKSGCQISPFITGVQSSDLSHHQTRRQAPSPSEPSLQPAEYLITCWSMWIEMLSQENKSPFHCSFDTWSYYWLLTMPGRGRKKKKDSVWKFGQKNLETIRQCSASHQAETTQSDPSPGHCPKQSSYPLFLVILQQLEEGRRKATC